MSKHIAYTITASGILLFVDGARYVIGNDHPNFGKIKEAVNRQDYDAVADLADIRASVRKWMNHGKEFSLKNDLIELNGVPFSAVITDKVLAMIDAGNGADPLFNFLRKVRENPSKSAQDELLLFCEVNGFMIHTDGDILAYKSVRGDYTDIHSGKFRNAVGDVVTMARHTVDDRRDVTCSTGLHFAAFDYASSWAGEIDGKNRRLMVMKINPKDVVSIPNDYNNQKGRCARYEVIAELTSGKPLPKKEVYSNRDVGAPCSCHSHGSCSDYCDLCGCDWNTCDCEEPIVNDEGRTVSEQAVHDAMVKELERKNAVREKWLNRAADVEMVIDALNRVDADADDFVNEADQLTAKIARIENEIRQLENDIENS